MIKLIKSLSSLITTPFKRAWEYDKALKQISKIFPFIKTEFAMYRVVGQYWNHSLEEYYVGIRPSEFTIELKLNMETLKKESPLVDEYISEETAKALGVSSPKLVSWETYWRIG